MHKNKHLFYLIAVFFFYLVAFPQSSWAYSSGEDALLEDLVEIDDPICFNASCFPRVYDYLYVDFSLKDLFSESDGKQKVIDYLTDKYAPDSIYSWDEVNNIFYVTYNSSDDSQNSRTYSLAVRNQVPANINQGITSLIADYPDGIIVNGVSVSDNPDYYFALTELLSQKYNIYLGDSFQNELGWIPRDYSKITVNSFCKNAVLDSFGGNGGINGIMAEREYSLYCDGDESRTFNLTFNEPLDKNIINQVSNYLNNVKNVETIHLDGYQLLNAMVSEENFISAFSPTTSLPKTRPFSGRAANYAQQTKELFDNKNIDITTPESDNYGCGGYFPYWFCGGSLLGSYNGYYYGGLRYGTVISNTFYIPEQTEDNPETYASTAEQLIREYLNADQGDIQVSYQGTRETISPEDETSIIDIDYYTFAIYGKEFFFTIEKDDAKAVPIPFMSEDLETGISIETESNEVPFDSNIQVVRVSNSNHQDVIDSLQIEGANIYDINLNSGSSKSKIKKLKNGSFDFKIPIPKELKNKKIVVYYISESGETEMIESKTNGNYINFQTNHLSEYMIGTTEQTESNPNSSDTILKVTGVLILSIISIVIISKVSSKQAGSRHH